MPCNLNQRKLAVDVKRGIRAAGGTPIEFNTISVSDGVSMGSEGMRASLVSREVIADSIELVALGHLFDGLVCLVGCDKTIPSAVMALSRLDLPGLVLYNGSIAPGRFRGRFAPKRFIVWPPVDIPERPAWWDRAACLGSGPTTWVIRKGAPRQAAKLKAICSGCPVRSECLADTLGLPIELNLYGPMSRRERACMARGLRRS